MKSRFALVALAALSLGLAPIRAQVTWSGLGGDDNWSTNFNWLLLAPPANGDAVNILSLGTGNSNLNYSVTLTGLDFGLLTGNFNLTASNGAVLTMGTNDTISFGSANTVNISAPIAGGGNLWLNGGTGTLILTAATPGQNTFSGSTQVYAGGTLSDGATDSFSAASSLGIGNGTVNVNYNEVIASLGDASGGPGTLNLAAGTTLLIDGGFSSLYSGVINGPASATLDYEVAGTLQLAGASPFTGTLLIGNNVAIELGNGGTTGSIAATTVTGSGSIGFDRSNAYTFSGTVTNAINVVQQGTGTTTLSGINTYTGTTTINAGTLQAGSTSAFGGVAGNTALTINGSGILELNGFSTDIGSLAGFTTTSQVLLTGGAILSVDNIGGNTTYAGNIHGTGGLTMNGYILSLTGTGSDYTGPTTINAGTLLLNNASGSATGLSSGIHISTGGTLQLGNLNTSGFLSAATGIYDYGSLTIAQSAGTTQIQNLIVGTGQLQKFGASTLVLYGGGASYSGNTVVYAGLMQDGSVNGFSASSTVQVASGATLENLYNDTIGSLQDYVGSAGTVIIGPGTTLTSGGLNYASSDFSGQIQGGGAFAVAGGVQGLSGNNTYTGGTVISGNGEVFAGSNTAFGTGIVTFEDATEFSPSADVTIANNLVLNGTTDIENDDGLNYNMTLTGQISGTNGLEWCTPGTLTLTNANTMMGGVDMREGNLILTNNSAAGTGAITLDSSTSLTVPTGITIANTLNPTGTGATVQGSGTLTAPLVVNSAIILNPIASAGGPGTLTFAGGLTLASGGSLNFQLYDATGAAGTGTSLLATTGGLDLTAAPGTFLVNVISVNSTGGSANAINFNPFAAQTWTLATSTSPITGFTGNQFVFNTGAFLNGGGIFNVTEVANNLDLNFTPVPEPSTWALVGAGTLAIAGLSIRRRRLARA